MENKDYLLGNKQNIFLENFCSNKYIKKLLELSPEYFEEFINNFNDNFNNINIENNYQVNQMSEIYLIKKEELIEVSKKIKFFLDEIDKKEITEFKKINQDDFLNEEFQKMCMQLKNISNDFDEKLLQSVEKIREEKEKDIKTNIVSFNTFSKHNNKIISNNYKSLEKINMISKEKKKINTKVAIVFISLFLIASFVCLMLYFFYV